MEERVLGSFPKVIRAKLGLGNKAAETVVSVRSACLWPGVFTVAVSPLLTLSFAAGGDGAESEWKCLRLGHFHQ